MRKIFLLIIIATLSFTASAQSSNANELAKKLLMVTSSGDLGVQMFSMMIAEYKKNLPDVPDEFWKKFSTEVKADEIVDLVVPIYVKHYSVEDMSKLIEFFQSPLGQKFVSKLPIITQESYAVGQQWGQKIGERVVKKLQDEGYLKKD